MLCLQGQSWLGATFWRSKLASSGLMNCGVTLVWCWIWLNARGLALDFRQRRACLLFGSVPPAQLLALAINDAGVDRQLVAHHRLAAGAASELDAPDLRR